MVAFAAASAVIDGKHVGPQILRHSFATEEAWVYEDWLLPGLILIL